jgi:hypothetical protein
MPARTVAEYLKSLPEDRRAALERVRAVVNAALPKGYEEGIQYGMIGWYVPHALYPAGYHAKPSEPLPLFHVGSRSAYMTLHLMILYLDPELRTWFEGAWKKTGKKLDLGGGCVRFKSIDGLALDVVGALVKKLPVKTYVKTYEAAMASRKAAPKAKAKAKTKAKAKPRS